MLGGQRRHRGRHDPHRGIVPLADDDQVRAALPAKCDGRRILDGDRLAQPHARGRGRPSPAGRLEQVGQGAVGANVRRGVALEDRWTSTISHTATGILTNPNQALVTLLVGEPGGLKRTVSFHEPTGVVVDGLAGPREQPGGEIVVVQDQLRVGLGTLQSDSNRHLAHGASRQARRAAQGLGPKQHVDPEGPALSHQPVEQHRGVLGQLVLLGEKHLKLVYDQQRARQGVPAGAAIRADVLNPALPEQLTAALHLRVDSLKNTQSEFAIALDRHRPGVRQFMRRIALELDALLEVHEIEFHLVGTIPQRQVRDDHVQQRGLAGAGLAGDESVLGHALA